MPFIVYTISPSNQLERHSVNTIDAAFRVAAQYRHWQIFRNSDILYRSYGTAR